MAIYPGAVFKPTKFGGKTPRNKQGRGILHVAVSGARSLPPWNGNTWHMYVAHDGYCEQYVDSDFRAYASGAANADAFQIETAGGLGPSKVLNAEKWTPAQAERLADIMAWLNKVDGTPLELLPDSKPGRRGWGPHRLGIQHSRGVGAVPGWLVPGGERWTSAIGKECPGDAKIAQTPHLIDRARGDYLEEYDVSAVEAKLDDLIARVGGVQYVLYAPGDQGSLLSRIGALQAVTSTTLAVTSKAADVDEEKLAAALAPTLVPAVLAAVAGKNTALTQDDVEAAIREVLGSLGAQP